MFSFMARLKREERGFTLIELMVVVAIIAILVAIAIPAYLNATTNAKVKANAANLRTIDGAISTYEAENGTTPTLMTQLVTTYLKASPKSPYTQLADYVITGGVAQPSAAAILLGAATTY